MRHIASATHEKSLLRSVSQGNREARPLSDLTKASRILWTSCAFLVTKAFHYIQCFG